MNCVKKVELKEERQKGANNLAYIRRHVKKFVVGGRRFNFLWNIGNAIGE